MPDYPALRQLARSSRVYADEVHQLRQALAELDALHATGIKFDRGHLVPIDKGGRGCMNSA